MAISPARVAAFDILLRVEQQASYASELLHAQRAEALSAADHRLATEIAMGVLRWRSVLDDHIAERSSQRLAKLDLAVLTSLRLGAYQLLFLERVPAHAAVHDSAELVKRARKASAAAFVNAVLRKLVKEKTTVPAALAADAGVADLARARAHPEWLVSRWVDAFGLEVAHKICAYDQAPPPVALRLFDAMAESDLEAEGIRLAPGLINTAARRLRSGSLIRAKAFGDGRIAIQDEASQLIALLAGFGNRILDCCAAPGGKTRILAQRNPESFIVAAELHPHRARLLQSLHAATKVRVIVADAEQLTFATEFDRVLVDAPCSGTGTLARNPEIKWRLKPEDLAGFRSRQLAILRSAMRNVCPGGRLIYATCSLESEENEDVVTQALGENADFRVRDCREELDRLRESGELAWPEPQSLTRGPYLRTIPGVHPCDGFFAAVLEKIA